ncbi:hypothetical protein TKK_0006732 [Trichogramma kaykai]|uniref:U2A'/phosphoprotein 32 family A C-terminal domain-containing protein n=1 Tax=Trichogramma kaykai TaxID=54128 RepID=A0ABD2XDD0_9HYME
MTSLGKQIFVAKNIHPRGNEEATTSISRHPTADSLSLAFENLFHMPYDIIENYGSTIHTLDISHNKFGRSLHFLAEFENLTSLNLDHNNIDSFTTFPFMPKLQLLWLNYNNIEELFPFLKNLHKSLPNLQFLGLMGNKAAPSFINGGNFYDYLQYRLYVISWFPLLDHLDDRAITVEQRLEAKRLFKRPFLEEFLEKHEMPECLKYLNSKITEFFTQPTTWQERFKFPKGPNYII